MRHLLTGELHGPVFIGQVALPCDMKTEPIRRRMQGRPVLVARSNATVPHPTRSVCHNDIVFRILTSHFPDLPFSGNAYFRNFVPIRKTCVKYFNICPSERIEINLYSHNYTVSNAKKASAEPISTVRSTCDWLRTDERLPSYGRVRTVVVVRPYENSHLSPFFRDRRGTISDV